MTTRERFFKRLTYLIAAVFIAGWLVGVAVDATLRDIFNPPRQVVHTVYTVQKGDTLWKIAEHYRAIDCRNPYILKFLEEIKSTNPQLKDVNFQINPGDVIRINYYQPQE